MSIDRARLALALAAPALLGACAIDPQTGQVIQPGPEMGEASRQTFMAQVIDPDPQHDTLVPVSSGEHAEAAIDRYRSDSVKQPETISTTAGASSGSSSGSSGGS